MSGWRKPRPGKKITRSGCVYHGVVYDDGNAPTNDAAIHAAMSYIADDGYDDTNDVCLAHSTLMSKIIGHHADDLPLSILPPVYKLFVPTAEQPSMPSLTLHNRALTIAATRASRFSIAVYGFISGHFLSSILSYC